SDATVFQPAVLRLLPGPATGIVPVAGPARPARCGSDGRSPGPFGNDGAGRGTAGVRLRSRVQVASAPPAALDRRRAPDRRPSPASAPHHGRGGRHGGPGRRRRRRAAAPRPPAHVVVRPAPLTGPRPARRRAGAIATARRPVTTVLQHAARSFSCPKH